MSDDTTDPRLELASAFLDEEVDAAERARAEASPEVLDLVATFAGLRASLTDVPPAPEAARESAIAAALAEFDHAAAPAAAAAALVHEPAGQVVAISSRRTWQWRILTGAAAAAVVLLIGAAVLSSNQSDDDSAFTKETEAARTLDASGQAATTPGVAPEAAADQTPRPTIAAIGGAADAVIIINTPAELLAFAGPVPPATPATDRDTGTLDTGTLDTTDAPAEQVDPNAATLSSPCAGPDQVVVAQIVYVDTPAIVVIDTVTGVVQALDIDTCDVVIEVTP